MAKGSSKLSGGSSSGGKTSNSNVSALTAWKENSRQLAEAKKEARAAKAIEIQYTDMNGDTYSLYWDGAKYTDKKSQMAQRWSDMSGVYKKKFKKPANW